MRKRLPSKRVFYNVGQRNIRLVGLIDESVCDLIEEAIQIMTVRNAKQEARLSISSNGGDYFASIRLFHIITRSIIPIDTMVLTHAYSGAFLVLQAGRRRYANIKATMRFHCCEHQALKGEWYNAKAHKYAAGELDKVDAVQLLIFTARSPYVSKISHLFFDKEAEITAQQAKKLNLIDKILDPKILKPR